MKRTKMSNDLGRWHVGCRAMLLLLCGLFQSGCIQRSEQTATIYCATDREFAAPILDAFERTQSDPAHNDPAAKQGSKPPSARAVPGAVPGPIAGAVPGKNPASFGPSDGQQNDGQQIVRVFDVEASKTLGLVTRIEQESAQPKCDVFWNNEILHTIRLQKAGLLEPRRWSIPDNWPEGFVASDRSWVGFAARARVLIVNTQKLAQREQWPMRVQELADPRWKGQCGYANAMYGTTATHFAVLASHSRALEGMEWSQWQASIKTNAVMLAGNKQVALAVSSGELSWGLTDTDDALIEKEKGMPIEMIFPDQSEGGFGAVFIPNTVAVIRRSPHPVLAGRLADYLISEKTESRLAMSSSAHFPIWPGAKEQSRIETLGIRRAKIDYELAAEVATRAAQSANKPQAHLP
ncbi:MAG: extracellular solute-binding protein [Planctomycetota bacterium]|nr:extracellular solute-binding protein [Planctomycetota bacterium]